MELDLRKFNKFVDKTFVEGGKKANEPVLLVSVAAVFKNPWHLSLKHISEPKRQRLISYAVF